MKIKLPDFTQIHIMVVGDVMLDRYWSGQCHRISPEAPVPVVDVNKVLNRPGGAANVAMNVVALGGKVTLVGIIGDDEPGSVLKDALSQANIESALIEDSSVSTIMKLRVMSRHQQLMRLDFEKPLPSKTAQQILEKMKTAVTPNAILVLSDYGKGTLKDIADIILWAKQQNLPVLVDPKGIDFSKYKMATLLTPNRLEFEAVVGVCHNEEALIKKGITLKNELQLKSLLITRGEEGMTLIDTDNTSHHFPATAQDVYDVTGAGDTVISTLALAMASNMPLEKAVQLANLAAGVVVGKSGTAVVKTFELAAALSAPMPDEKWLNSNELESKISELRRLGKKLVFTNGCFDLLHAGHVAYLKQARECGDFLLVAVNSDASVKRLKGKTRPVHSLEDRMAVLAGLKSVDFLVDFDQDTPMTLLHQFKPEVLVKGGDYQLDEVVGSDWVRGYGGVVKVLAHMPERSTTNTLSKITDSNQKT